MKSYSFDPLQHQREKAIARRADDADLVSGRVSHAAMRQRNGAFAHIDFSQAKIILEDAPDSVLL